MGADDFFMLRRLLGFHGWLAHSKGTSNGSPAVFQVS
jgi:hypothetical protein